MPTITHAPELRVVGGHRRSAHACRREHRCDEERDLAVLGARRGEQLRGRSGDRRRGSPSPSRTSPRSVLCAIASPDELHDDRVAERVGRRDRAAGVATTGPGRTGSPYAASSAFDSGSESVRVLRGLARVGRRSHRTVLAGPELVAQDTLQELARVGARQLVAHLVAARALVAADAFVDERSELVEIDRSRRASAGRPRRPTRPTRRRGRRRRRRR